MQRTPNLPHGGLIQRACACGQHTPGGGECASCKQKRLQRSAAGAGPATAPPIVHAVLGTGGQPLDAATRSFMEPRFGRDFGGVRVHTGAQAAESARAVGALAYTVGGHIAFGAGQYAPHTGAGRRLLAHELAHTVQQGGGSPAVQRLAVGAADTPDERAAERAAEQVSAGAAIAVGPAPGGAQLQRACGPAAIGTPGGCTNVSGEIVGERFRFVVNCDDLQPGELSRVQMFAATIASGEAIEVHGFASLDGNAAFNEQLSCARALKAQAAIQAVLTTMGIAATVQAFNHGATPGAAAERRSVVITRSGTVPPLPPTPPPGSCLTPTNADRSGSAFNPTTASQAQVALLHMRDALTANSLANDALAAASSSGLAGLHLGPADAFRHCLWNCRMAQDLGAARAEEFATGHENSGPSGIPHDNQMDLHNNAMGRSFGTPGADCAAECQAAVTAGLLRTIRGPGTSPPATPPVTTWCIGASHQIWP